MSPKKIINFLDETQKKVCHTFCNPKNELPITDRYGRVLQKRAHMSFFRKYQNLNKKNIVFLSDLDLNIYLNIYTKKFFF